MNKRISYFLKLMLLNISLYMAIKFFEKEDDRLYVEKYLDKYNKTKNQKHTGWISKDVYKGTFETIDFPTTEEVNEAFNYKVKMPGR